MNRIAARQLRCLARADAAIAERERIKRGEIIWTPAKVGCWWHSGDFTIGTRMVIENGRCRCSGYVLTRDFEELGIFNTLDAAQQAAALIVEMDTTRIEVTEEGRAFLQEVTR